MLFSPDIMPEFDKRKTVTRKFRAAVPKSGTTVQKNRTVDMRQNEKGKHYEPSIYTAVKVEKRKS